MTVEGRIVLSTQRFCLSTFNLHRSNQFRDKNSHRAWQTIHTKRKWRLLGLITVPLFLLIHPLSGWFIHIRPLNCDNRVNIAPFWIKIRGQGANQVRLNSLDSPISYHTLSGQLLFLLCRVNWWPRSMSIDPRRPISSISPLIGHVHFLSVLEPSRERERQQSSVQW